MRENLEPSFTFATSEHPSHPSPPPPVRVDSRIDEEYKCTIVVFVAFS
jgi:hypothetical protein